MRRRPRNLLPKGTYTDWWWAAPAEGLSSVEHVLVPEIDPGPEATYFWAHQVQMIDGAGGYIGLQTRANLADGSVDKIALFSLWQATGGRGGQAAPFSGEGEGWSCRIRFRWQAGRRYRLGLRLVDRSPEGGWWAASAGEEGGDAEEVGQILVPPAWKGLGRWSVMWTEYYGPPLARCADLAYSRVVFGVPAAESGTVVPERSANHLGGGQCDTSRVTALDGGVRHEMGLSEGGG